MHLFLQGKDTATQTTAIKFRDPANLASVEETCEQDHEFSQSCQTSETFLLFADDKQS